MNVSKMLMNYPAASGRGIGRNFLAASGGVLDPTGIKIDSNPSGLICSFTHYHKFSWDCVSPIQLNPKSRTSEKIIC